MATNTQKPATAPPPRPYRDYLTPTLHRRFTNAALLAAAACYVDAVAMGQFDPIWMWFPLGRAGMRTFSLLVPMVATFVLRVASMHVGSRMTTSPFSTFLHYGFNKKTIQVFLWYSFSAWWFCETTIWAAPIDSKLGMVALGARSSERPRLNERPLFYRSMFWMFAVVQSTLHQCKDYGKLPLGVEKGDQALPQSTSTLVRAATPLKYTLSTIAKESLFWTIPTMIIGPIIYTVFLRETLWNWAFFFVKPFWKLPKSSKLPNIPPLNADLMARIAFLGLLLLVMWGVANSAFSICSAQEPIKKNQPITSDATDPNGSLLAGLKAKNQLPKSFAFWELAIIAHHFQARRDTIYKEIERKDGETWSQVMAACLGELHAIVKRIQDYQHPPQAPTQKEEPIKSLPKIAGPLKEENIVKPSPSSQNPIGNFAKAHGQSPEPNPISPRAKKLLAYGADSVLSKEQQQHLSKEGVEGVFQSYIIQILRTPLGIPFRHTFARRANVIVLGSPFSSFGPIINGTTALTKLCVHSLKEDQYGVVQRDVPNIVRTFTSTCNTIEEFLKTFPVHWTDVEFDKKKESEQRKVDAIEEILLTIRNGLRDLVNEFGEYADALGLSLAEVKAAKEAVSKGSGKTNSIESDASVGTFGKPLKAAIPSNMRTAASALREIRLDCDYPVPGAWQEVLVEPIHEQTPCEDKDERGIFNFERKAGWLLLEQLTMDEAELDEHQVKFPRLR